MLLDGKLKIGKCLYYWNTRILTEAIFSLWQISTNSISVAAPLRKQKFGYKKLVSVKTLLISVRIEKGLIKEK